MRDNNIITQEIFRSPKFAHAYDIHREIITLIQRGELRLVKIVRLENLPVFTTGDGWGYCFIRGPQPYPSTSYSPVVISSLIDARTFFNALNVGEKELRLFAHHNPAIALLLEQEGDFLQRFVEGLADRSILAYKVPVHSAAPPVKAVEYIAATAVDREVPLAPEAGAAPAIVRSTLSERKGVPPKSLGDAENRLRSMKQEIAANGHIPKYSDAQLLQH